MRNRNRRSTRFAVVSGAALVAAVAASCSRPSVKPEPETISEVRLGETATDGGTVLPQEQAEPSAAYTAPGWGQIVPIAPEVLVVGYNEFAPPSTTTPHGGEWAFSLNRTTFTKCRLNDPACSADGTAHSGYGFMGHPAVVSNGTGLVGYVSVAEPVPTATNRASKVLLMTSGDAGQTFYPPLDVTYAAATAVGGNAACGIGWQDLPDATMEPGSDRITIVWRNRSATGSLASFGACITTCTLSTPVPNIVTCGPARVIPQDTEDDGNFAMGLGGIRVRTGDGLTTVVYQNNDLVDACVAVPNIGWEVTTSDDDGASWTTPTYVLEVQGPGYATCGAGLWRGLRPFDFVRGVGGVLYVAINYEDTGISLFQSHSAGAAGTWQQLVASNGIVAWVPVEFPVFEPGGGGSTNDHPTFSSNQPLLFPSLATDASGALAITYYEATANEKRLHLVARGSINPGNASIPWNPPVASAATKLTGNIRKILDTLMVTSGVGWDQYQSLIPLAAAGSTCGKPGPFEAFYTRPVPGSSDTTIANIEFTVP